MVFKVCAAGRFFEHDHPRPPARDKCTRCATAFFFHHREMRRNVFFLLLLYHRMRLTVFTAIIRVHHVTHDYLPSSVGTIIIRFHLRPSWVILNYWWFLVFLIFFFVPIFRRIHYLAGSRVTKCLDVLSNF